MVTVPVEAGPAFTLRFQGNRRYPSAWLRSALAINPAETLDRSVLEREARRVEAFYRYRGFRNVRVEPRETVSPDGNRAVVVFHVAEGRQFRVRQVEFEGRAGLSESELRTVLDRVVRDRRPEPSDQRLESDPLHLSGRSPPEGRPDTPDPAPSEVFVEDAWRDAADTMQRAYRELGWTDAAVSLVGAAGDVPSGTLDVRFHIVEGVRTFVRGVRFEGLRSGSLRPTCRCSPPVSPSASHGWKTR